MIEIRWHGRGGQGAKTASHVLAAAALNAGRWVQAFPEYGPERSGAPVRAYDRLDGRPVRRRSPVTRPHVAVVLDDTLLDEVDVVAGLRPGGIVIVNSKIGSGALRRRLGFVGSVLTVAASDIAAATGAGRANVVLLGALAGVLGEPPLGAVRAAVRDALAGKLDAEGLEGAYAGMEKGYRAALANGILLHASADDSNEEAGRFLESAVEGTAHLEPFQPLPAGAVVEPGGRARPVTGTWREGERPQVDLSLCVNCLLCWLYCPDMAVLAEDGRLKGFDYTVCKGCELCVEACPVDAIVMVPEPASRTLRLVGGAA